MQSRRRDGQSMTSSGTLESLGRARHLPVVVSDDVADALPLADALVSGGLLIAGVTLRTSAALEGLRLMAVGGSWMVPCSAIRAREFAMIVKLTATDGPD